ncbi:MAG: hypothetical protein ACPGJS_08875 [Flammeovirgaceae bacterium]
MLHKAYLFCLFFLISITHVQAQLSQLPIGARAMAMGGANSTVSDGWAIFNNPAGLAREDALSAGFTYHYPYNLAALSTRAAYASLPIKFGNLGLGAAYFGDRLFNEQKISLAYAQKISNVDFGMRVNYHQFSAQNYGSRSLVSFDLGSTLQLTKNIYLGTSIHNLLRARLVDFEDERLPTSIRIGISYRPIDQLMLNVEAIKDIDFEPTVLVGVEYKVVKAIAVRGGISTEPTTTYFGLGLQLKKFNIDYSLTNHTVLGISQQLSLSMNIKSIKKQKQAS